MLNISSSLSTINFCDKRINLIEANKVIANYASDCLAPAHAQKYTELAMSGEYPEVLGAIWKDKTHRLTFLQQLAPQLHGVLLFELGMAEFLASKTVETVNLVVLPLFKAAVFRVRQDAQCSQDPSICYGDADTRLSLVYAKSLDTATKKYLGQSLEEVQAVHIPERHAAIKARIRDTALASQQIDLPSPHWLRFHGMSHFFSESTPMHSITDIKKIRDNFADQVLKELSSQ